MSPTSRFAPVLAAAFITLALAGCGSKAEGTGTTNAADGVDSSMTAAATSAAVAGAGDSASGGTCPTVSQGDYELFTTDQVAVAPVDGAIYGDGTTISWTFAGPPAGTPDVDISYVNDAGDAIPTGGIFLEDLGDNEWGSSLNVFNSDEDGRPAFMTLGLTDDAGAHTIVGRYCVTIKVAP